HTSKLRALFATSTPAESRFSKLFLLTPSPSVMRTASELSPMPEPSVVPVPQTHVLARATEAMVAPLYSFVAFAPAPPLLPAVIVAFCTPHSEPASTTITVLVAVERLVAAVASRVQLIVFVPDGNSRAWQPLWSGRSASAVSQPAPLKPPISVTLEMLLPSGVGPVASAPLPVAFVWATRATERRRKPEASQSARHSTTVTTPDQLAAPFVSPAWRVKTRRLVFPLAARSPVGKGSPVNET